MDQARLRPAQVGASTAAAVGGAFLATRLGVYGTIIGVGVITLMSTVGSEMLLRSIERTRQAARTTPLRPRPMGSVMPAAAIPAYHAAAADTVELPLTGHPADGLDMAATSERRPTDAADTVDMAATAEQSPTATRAERPSSDEQPPKARRWTLVAGGFAASFALALAVIAGIEAFTGQSLDGEGEPTVVTVFRGGEQRTDDAPSVPTTPTDEPTSTQEAGSEPTGDPEDGTAPRPEPDASVESPAPADSGDSSQPEGEQTPQPDGQAPPPDGADETPPPDEEVSPPVEEEASPPPGEEETSPPDDDQPTPQP